MSLSIDELKEILPAHNVEYILNQPYSIVKKVIFNEAPLYNTSYFETKSGVMYDINREERGEIIGIYKKGEPILW